MEPLWHLPQGIYILSGPNQWVRIEDCYVTGWGSGISFDPDIPPLPAPQWSHRADNISVRRCVVVDNYKSDGPFNDNGLYVEETDGLLIEECVFDANGWNVLENTFSERTPLDHNMYIQYDCTGVRVSSNISARGGADNYQLRPIGVVENNLSLKAPIHFSLGYYQIPPPTIPRATGSILRNVALMGDDIDPTDPSLQRGWGYYVCNVGMVGGPQTVMSGNIATNKGAGGLSPQSIYLDGGRGGIDNMVVNNNIVYEWGDNAIADAPLRIEYTNTIPGTGIGSLLLHSNDFFNSSTGRAFQAPVVGGNPSTRGWDSYGNRFWTGKPNRSFMRWLGADLTVDGVGQWRSQVNDPLTGHSPSVEFQVPDYTDPSRDIVSYCQALQLPTHSLDAFLAECRLQRKGNWRTEYTGLVAVQYFQDGFAPPTTGPG